MGTVLHFQNISFLMLLATLSKIVRFGYTFYTFLQNIKLSDFEDSNRKKTISEFVCTKTVLRSYYSYYILFFVLMSKNIV